MANKNFLNPFILALHYEDDSEYTGGASAHGNLDPDVPYPMSWAAFIEYYRELTAEMEGGPFDPDFQDYMDFWEEHWDEWGGIDAWNELNPDHPWGT